MKAMAKILLMDWQRAKIPYFVAPPKEEEVGKEKEDVKMDGEEDKNKKYGIDQKVEDIEVTKKEFGGKEGVEHID